MRPSLIAAAVLSASLHWMPTAALADEKAPIDAMEAYLGFVDYGGAPKH